MVMVQADKHSLHLTLQRNIDDSYDIVFGFDIFQEIGDWLKAERLGSKHAIITDSNVRPLHASRLEETLQRADLKTDTFVIPAGEANKRAEVCLDIIGQMSQRKYGRDSVILALGGGVVGDVAGFIAAIYNRGIPFVQIPTSLLAMADASVGGKTGVDLRFGKNLVGAFWQPKRVYIDIDTLKTLPDEEYVNGLAETIKHGVIYDRDFFNFLEEHMWLILQRDAPTALQIARKNCMIKGSVVEKDPNERGLRRILNYGHTAGHAIESLSDYKMPHGHCVSIGMMIAGRISRDLCGLSQRELDRQERMLIATGLPVTIPSHIPDDDIIEVTLRDKKAKDGKARYSLPKRIGEMNDYGGAWATYVPEGIVRSALRATR